MAIMCHGVTNSNTHFANVTRRFGNGAAQLALARALQFGRENANLGCGTDRSLRSDGRRNTPN
ncbi:hypothetical protein MESS2_1690013 [Mesorhizobium metallidurans STM 2683]|uniref:Uncharacterized protein n=1 Tax=Mesorhizobium metallidurans STM 2683 TaxID=1297569 RepID=M5ENH5_9HYPH|nr:hypothetical protein MESS2_1690013 [Mesorhizobium metallidurans STM 2683]